MVVDRRDCLHTRNITTVSTSQASTSISMPSLIRNPLSPLLLFLVALLLLQAPCCEAWLKKNKAPDPKEQDDDEGVVQAVVAAAVAMVPPTLPQKLPYLVGATLAGSTDTLVHKFFNESDCTDLKHEKGRYQRTLLYAGEYVMCTSSIAFCAQCTGIATTPTC